MASAAQPARRTRPRAAAAPARSRPRRPTAAARPRTVPRSKLALERRVVVLTTVALVSFGLVMVYSATSASATLAGGSPGFFALRQAIYAFIGLFAMAVVARFDFRRWRFAAPPLLATGLALCVAVLVPGIGVDVNGATRWFAFGPITFQPSELLKLGLAVWVPWWLARRQPPATFGELLKPMGLIVGFSCALIVVEPDLGTAIAIAIMVGGALFVAGTRLLLLVQAGLIAGGLAIAAIWQEDYRRERFFAFLHPHADPSDTGYQTIQAMISIGSGGLFGRGLGEGVQKIEYLPEAHTDMIAAVVGEEVGFIGMSGLIVAYGLFAWAGLRIALECKDRYGKILAGAITALLCGQAAVNLAAVLGLAPITGIPLPLVSYGGTSLVVSLLAIGILLNIASNHGRQPATQVRSGGGRNRGSSDARARRR